MDTTQRQAKQDELTRLRSRVAELERDLATPPGHWQASDYYGAYHATAGFLLGSFGAATSLLLNVVGSLAVGQHPLRLIQIYLTFPLGAEAKQLESGMTLAIGCCLYLATGMLLGIPFQLALARWGANSLPRRLVVASVLAVAVWLISFYVLLSWLQPLLFGGNWIVREVPLPVAAMTHLVFGWTMAVAYPLGAYVPYRPQTETA